MAKTKSKLRKLYLSKKFVFLALAVLLIAGGVLYSQLHETKNPNPSPGDGVNLSPATPEEKKEAEAHKDEIVRQGQSTPPPTGTKKNVTPIITLADKTELRAYVPGVFEDGGTCTATATQGVQTKSKTSNAFGNVSTTQCTPLVWDTPLGTGSWTITVKYNSATAAGVSEAKEVK